MQKKENINKKIQLAKITQVILPVITDLQSTKLRSNLSLSVQLKNNKKLFVPQNINLKNPNMNNYKSHRINQKLNAQRTQIIKQKIKSNIERMISATDLIKKHEINGSLQVINECSMNIDPYLQKTYLSFIFKELNKFTQIQKSMLSTKKSKRPSKIALQKANFKQKKQDEQINSSKDQKPKQSTNKKVFQPCKIVSILLKERSIKSKILQNSPPKTTIKTKGIRNFNLKKLMGSEQRNNKIQVQKQKQKTSINIQINPWNFDEENMDFE